MSNQQLQDYMYRQIGRGVSRDDVKKVLIEKGWAQLDVDGAMKNMTPDSKESSPVAVVGTVDTPDNSATQSSPSKKKFVGRGLVFLLLSLLILVGASAGGYFYIYLAPEKVVARSLVKMQDVRIFKYSGEANIYLTGSAFDESSETSALPEYGGLLAGSSPDSYSVIFSGDLDMNDSTNSKSSALINLKIDETSFTEIEMRNKEKVTYINIHNLESLGLIDTSMFINRWIKFDLTELAKEYGQEIYDMSDITLTEEEVTELGGIFSDYPPFEITGKLASESINGNSTYHYKFGVNKENLSKLTVKAIESVTGEVMDDASKEDFSESLINLDFTDGEIWIGKKDMYIYKLKFGLTSTQNSTSDLAATLDFDVSFDSYNLPFDVEVPSDYSTFEEIIAEAFGEFEMLTEIGEIPIDMDMPELSLPSEESNLEIVPGG